MANGQPWVLVDTQARTLSVMQGGKPALVFSDISIGRYGATLSKRRGDHKTPLGDFRIAWIREDSPFHRFMGLDYPSLEYARRAYEEGRLSEQELKAIRQAVAKGRLPPQNTTLGGRIGLHGLGGGDPKVHQDFNWTNGCIALTNEQIDQLMTWVAEGTRVSIR
jgi:murein L,D-transpeptidase YafK